MLSDGAVHFQCREAKGNLNMQALLILVALVVLAAAARYGVDSRDGADWSPPAQARR